MTDLEALTGLLLGSQLVFTFIAGIYFYVSLKGHFSAKSSGKLSAGSEFEKLKKLRKISLNVPLSEKTRPGDISEIIGQEKGIKALKAALFGENPQHVLIYGPPGVGKTAAARIVLEMAKNSEGTPFLKNAPFIELDGTILQFDERSIADPLIGSVHDPIYQGAGAYGQAGIPKPKEGAVTKAHGGVLFLDEIGELHSIQMNKLLKVLEDRKVFLNSSYYSESDKNIPNYIHDIFKNGLPADFRLIGATTRRPEDIPNALRSRCIEIFFRPLKTSEIRKICENACKKSGFSCDEEAWDTAAQYCENGRDAVNLVQTALSIAALDNRKKLLSSDFEEVASLCMYVKKPKKPVFYRRPGLVFGLSVGNGGGHIMQIEAFAQKVKSGGKIKVTGILDEEEIKTPTGFGKRRSSSKSSVENVITLFKNVFDVNMDLWDVHINFPGGMAVDGPSGGIAIFSAVYSAIFQRALVKNLAMTGEISLSGRIYPVGGVDEKIEAAIAAGCEGVIIPKDNYKSLFSELPIEVIAVENIGDVIKSAFMKEQKILLDVRDIG